MTAWARSYTLTEHCYTCAVVWEMSLRELCGVCRVGAGVLWIATQWSSPTTTPAPLQTQSPAQHQHMLRERQPEPNAEGEPKPIATDEPSPERATELRITPEPEPHRSPDQVLEQQHTRQWMKVRAQRKAPPTVPPWGWAEAGGFNRLLFWYPQSSSIIAWILCLSCYSQEGRLWTLCLSLNDHGGCSPVRDNSCNGSCHIVVWATHATPEVVAFTSELSVCPVTTKEVVPLSAALSVLGVALWCVWAA